MHPDSESGTGHGRRGFRPADSVIPFVEPPRGPMPVSSRIVKFILACLLCAVVITGVVLLAKWLSAR